MTQVLATESSTLHKIKPFFLWRHLNKLRWFILALVFATTIILPFLSLYQAYAAAHAYDLLFPEQKLVYNSMEWLTQPFISDPEHDLDHIKGTTWSGYFFGYKISDPLAVLSQTFAAKGVYLPFILTALIPALFTILFGRFFCGWICPAALLYELNSNLSIWLEKLGIKTGRRNFSKRFKYLVLAAGLIASAIFGSVLTAAIYPPAIIGREIYYAIALGGFGSGVVFFLLTIMFDLLVTRRGFCNYLCPGGALYSLLGRFRPLRIKRIVENCNDCAKCNAVCEFKLNPMRDDFGQECNNCTACIAVCPTEAMTFAVRLRDLANQGPGHLGKAYKKHLKEKQPGNCGEAT